MELLPEADIFQLFLSVWKWRSGWALSQEKCNEFSPLENAKWKSLLLLTAHQSFCPCHELPWPDFSLNFDSWFLGISGAPPLTRPWVWYLSDVTVVFSCCCWQLYIATSSLGYTLLTFIWNVQSGCKWADLRVGIPWWKNKSKPSDQSNLRGRHSRLPPQRRWELRSSVLLRSQLW